MPNPPVYSKIKAQRVITVDRVQLELDPDDANRISQALYGSGVPEDLELAEEIKASKNGAQATAAQEIHHASKTGEKPARPAPDGSADPKLYAQAATVEQAVDAFMTEFGNNFGSAGDDGKLRRMVKKRLTDVHFRAWTTSAEIFRCPNPLSH